MKTIAGLLIFFLFCNIPIWAQDKKMPLDISHLTGSFYVYTTYHLVNNIPFPSNSLYVVTNAGVILIDTPWDSTKYQPLLDSIYNRHQQKVVLCIATHFHEDRTGGFSFFEKQGIKTFASRLTYDLLKGNKTHLATNSFTKDTLFKVGNISFQTFYPGEGHTNDNIVIWFEDQKILYGGCFVKSVEAKNLGNLNDAEPATWPGSINKVKMRFPSPAFIIPGHQDWSSLRSLDHTLNLLEVYNKKK